MVVPVRSSMMIGVAVDVGDGDRAGLKEVILAPDPEPLVPRTLLDLADWVSRYYATPLGLVLKTMLPSALWGRSQLVATIVDEGAAPGGTSADVLAALQHAGGRATATQLGRRLRRPVWDVLQRLARSGAVVLETQPPRLGPAGRQERLLTLVRAFPTILERDEVFGRAKAQRALYEAVDQLGGTVPVAHLTEAMGFSGAVIRAVVKRGIGPEQSERGRRVGIWAPGRRPTGCGQAGVTRKHDGRRPFRARRHLRTSLPRRRIAVQRLLQGQVRRRHREDAGDPASHARRADMVGGTLLRGRGVGA